MIGRPAIEPHALARSNAKPVEIHVLDLPRVSPVDQRQCAGPFDVIGDVHGCAGELEELLGALNYRPDAGGTWRSRTGRIAVFVGDFVDRGPRIVDTVMLVRDMVRTGAALAVPGNHDIQLARFLRGEPVRVEHGLQSSLDALEASPPHVSVEVEQFLSSLPGHVVLDHGQLVVAHTGLGAERHLDPSDETYRTAVYGVADGAMDPFDVFKRHPWLRGYGGPASVVYGHTASAEAVWQGPTIDIDTGCVFGGRLTALRWPERTLNSVDARAMYVQPSRPLAAAVPAWS